MTYVTYEVSTINGNKVVKTLAEALASGMPYRTIYTAEPLKTGGSKVKGQVATRSEYMTGNFAKARAKGIR